MATLIYALLTFLGFSVPLYILLLFLEITFDVLIFLNKELGLNYHEDICCVSLMRFVCEILPNTLNFQHQSDLSPLLTCVLLLYVQGIPNLFFVH